MSTAAQVVIQQADSDDHLVAMWLGTAASPHTRRAYRNDIEEFLRFTQRPLRRITVGQVMQYTESLFARGLRESSVGRKVAAVKSLFRFGERIGYISLNPAAVVRQPKTPLGVRRRVPSAAEVRRFLRVAAEASPVLGLLARSLYVTGARISEAMGLRHEDVIVRDGDGVVTLLGKGNRQRSVAVPLELAGEMLASSRPGEPVFPVTAWVLRYQWRAAARRAGMKWMTPHCLRHAHATHAIQAGCPLTVLRDTLGHASLVITSRYVHATPGESSAKFIKETQE